MTYFYNRVELMKVIEDFSQFIPVFQVIPETSTVSSRDGVLKVPLLRTVAPELIIKSSAMAMVMVAPESICRVALF